MNAQSLSRKKFLVLTISSAAVTLVGCGGEDEPTTPGGTGGKGGSGGSGGGTSGSGGGGTGGGGTGGSGGSAGGTGGGGTGGGGTGGGGTGGSSGGGTGGSGGAPGGMCGTAAIEHTSDNQHTHIPGDATTLIMDLETHINGATATMAFTLPQENDHSHTITLTAEQVTTLKGGGEVTGIMSSEDGNHTHEYTLSCTA